MNTLYHLSLSVYRRQTWIHYIIYYYLYIEDKHEYIISFIIIQHPVTQNGRPDIPTVYHYMNSQIQLRSWQLELPCQVRSFDHPEFPCQVKVWQPELPCQIEALTSRTPRSGKSFDYPDTHSGQKLWQSELPDQVQVLTSWTPRSGKSFDYTNSYVR